MKVSRTDTCARIILETERLICRELVSDDASHIRTLLTDPDYIRFVGDRGLKTDNDAQAFIEERLQASYREFGFGFYLVIEKASGAPIGICGLAKRLVLEHVDVGYALLPVFRGRGYAFEATTAMMEHGRVVHGLSRIGAIISPGNVRSVNVVEKLGMAFEKMVRLSPEDDEIMLYLTSPVAEAE